MTFSAAMVYFLAQAAAATPATTAPAAPTAPQRTKAALQAQIKTSFEGIDANKDGWVDKAETMKAYDEGLRRSQTASFARLDTNKDGSISRQEFDAAAPKPSEAQKSAWLTTNDVDKNGRVALAEATAKAINNFDRLDADKNGVLTNEEVRAARTARRR